MYKTSTKMLIFLGTFEVYSHGENFSYMTKQLKQRLLHKILHDLESNIQYVCVNMLLG